MFINDLFFSTQPNNRKRQLPNIPAAQLHANREKGLHSKKRQF
jgi:hypothetical protein